MASQGYRDWLNAGRPYHLIRPAKAVQATLRGYGLTVYDFPDDGHLQANTPEDHTPFSATGWPAANKRWNARALDVMPRSGSLAHRKENADIARQIIRDKDAGHPGVAWVKYINWTDEAGNCVQVSWKPSKATKKSTDKGHIHISGRSDVDDDARADGYDPIARLNGEDYSVADSQLIANAERAVTAIVAGTEIIQFDYPWPGVPEAGFPNPIVAIGKQVKAIAADVASVKAAAVAGGVDPATVAALVVEQLGPLLPTLADIEQIVATQVKAALNGTHLNVN